MEGGIKRPLVDLNSLTRDLLKPLRNPLAMRRFERHDLQNQHVERALRDWESRRHHLASTFDT
jgi:hypothetical protein